MFHAEDQRHLVGIAWIGMLVLDIPLVDRCGDDREVRNHGHGADVRDDVYTNGLESVWAAFVRLAHGTWCHVSK